MRTRASSARVFAVAGESRGAGFIFARAIWTRSSPRRRRGCARRPPRMRSRKPRSRWHRREMRTVTCPIPRSRRRASARRVRHPRRGVCDSFTEDSSPIDYPSLRFPPSRATRDARCDLARDADHPHPSLHASAGVPWTEEEHRLFLLGLQKLGKVRYNPSPRDLTFRALQDTTRRRRRARRARVDAADARNARASGYVVSRGRVHRGVSAGFRGNAR